MSYCVFNWTVNTTALFPMWTSDTAVAYCSLWSWCTSSHSGRRSDPDRPGESYTESESCRSQPSSPLFSSYSLLCVSSSTLCLLHLLSGFSLVSASQSSTQEPPALVTHQPTGLNPHSTAGRKTDPAWLYIYICTPTRVPAGMCISTYSNALGIRAVGYGLHSTMFSRLSVLTTVMSYQLSSSCICSFLHDFEFVLSSHFPTVMDTQHI